MNYSNLSSLRMLHTPVSRWPLLLHVVLAVLILVLVGVAGRSLVNQSRLLTRQAQEHLDALQLQSQQQSAQALQAQAGSASDFTQKLPGRGTADDVMRDMARSSVSLGLKLGAITLTHQDSSSRVMGHVQFSVSANGDYSNAKAWLAELLARYSSLAVQNLTVRPSATDMARQEWQLLFTLYVRD
jgi:Tfp pilus assembly protein PilO